MTEEARYIKKRIFKSRIESILFYMSRIVPINNKKIVFTTVEGRGGYTCNPKYIAEEFIKQNKNNENKYELVWLVDDVTKEFPKEIKKVKNTLLNRAFQLSTSKFWIDNSRKQLECRKRKKQIYIQTWHAKLGFKPTCLDRGESFSKIAYLVSKHDSDMVDYWLSNSDWYDNTLPTGSLYTGKVLRAGSPRCDILVRAAEEKDFKRKVKQELYTRLCRDNRALNKTGVQDIDNIHFIMYAPTFRGGSQNTKREISAGEHFPDYMSLKASLEKKFGGSWLILLRLHPQLAARNIKAEDKCDFVFDASKVDDLYEMLPGCDAFITDYSSCAFDAAVMKIPVFLYCDDYAEYENERGRLLWDLKAEEFPFSLAEDDIQLSECIREYDEQKYISDIDRLFKDNNLSEDGNASKKVVEFIRKL